MVLKLVGWVGSDLQKLLAKGASRSGVRGRIGSRGGGRGGKGSKGGGMASIGDGMGNKGSGTSGKRGKGDGTCGKGGKGSRKGGGTPIMRAYTSDGHLTAKDDGNGNDKEVVDNDKGKAVDVTLLLICNLISMSIRETELV
ncbi:hypothetical protein Tco_0152330 [Tanacetum coccineum]